MVLDKARYIDPGLPLGAYAQEVFCECPKCAAPALVRGKVRNVVPFRIEQARVQCLRCSFSQDWSKGKWHGSVVGYKKERCLNCGHKWLIANVRKDELTSRVKRTRTIKCPECNHSSELRLKWFRDQPMGNLVDPYFGFPLWLQTECCGDMLWAYNSEHLNILKSYVAAVHRQRYPSLKWSMIARLPQWIKSAKNRQALLTCLNRLENKMNEVGGR